MEIRYPLGLSLVCMWLVAAGVRYVAMLSSTFLILVLTSILRMTLGCILFAAGAFSTGMLESTDRNRC
jgi:hypothetical protein